MTEPVDPETVTAALPFVPPKQLAGVGVTEQERALDPEMLTEQLVEQPLMSVTVTL